ncbi:hypothetical protein KCP77_24780 (plasmid) [Salmonella enterica subsp. enterica]|nr:hypothetical protein KCP77_24780 [Salmonella enterica subsp. enterica]
MKDPARNGQGADSGASRVFREFIPARRHLTQGESGRVIDGYWQIHRGVPCVILIPAGKLLFIV